MMDFMDSLRRGVDRAGFEVDRLLRANRIRSRISALRSEADGDLREIGLQVMELYGRNESVPEGLLSRCEKASKLQAEIRAQEAELEAVNSEAPPEDAEGEPPVAAAVRIECPRCGSSVPEGANFCPKCGLDLAARVEPETPVTESSASTEPPAPAG